MNNLVRKFSLLALDLPLTEKIRDSLILGNLLSIFESLRSKLSASPVKALGPFCGQAAFIIMLALYAALGLPQFASDKEGLAIISLAATSLYIVGRLLGAGGPLRLNCLDGFVLLYLGANIVSTFSSHYMMPAVKGLSKALVYVITYFLLKSTLEDNPRRLPWYLSAVLISGVAVSLYGLYQYKIGVAPLATWEDPSIENKGTRIYSTLGNPNLLAGYLLPMIPLSLGLGFYWLHLKNKLLRFASLFICMGIAVLITVAIFMTGCRGGYLALAATGAFTVMGLTGLLYTKKPKLVFAALGAIILALVAAALAVHFVAPTFEQRLLSIFAGSEHSSNAYRMHVWRASIAMFEDNWWLGVGPGNTAFRLAYGLYMKSGFDALGTYCVPLEIGVETGILGLIAAIGLIVTALSRAHLIFYMSGFDDPKMRYLALGMAAALVALTVHGFVDTVFYRPQVHFIFWLLVSSLSACSQNEKKA